MKLLFLVFTFVIGFQFYSCLGTGRPVEKSENKTEANEKVDHGNDYGSVGNQSGGSKGLQNVEKPEDMVLFDGKNYVKKSGWKVPSQENAYVDESYNQDDPIRRTESGVRIRTTMIHYFLRKPWVYSQDFHFDGSSLDSLKGTLKTSSFLKMSGNGKVFFYSISVEKAESPSASNTVAHIDPFGYQIMDTDGDGIFETLLGEYDEIIVPEWVAR
jgi:hypothetical protein